MVLTYVLWDSWHLCVFYAPVPAFTCDVFLHGFPAMCDFSLATLPLHHCTNVSVNGCLSVSLALQALTYGPVWSLPSPDDCCDWLQLRTVSIERDEMVEGKDNLIMQEMFKFASPNCYLNKVISNVFTLRQFCAITCSLFRKQYLKRTICSNLL